MRIEEMNGAQLREYLIRRDINQSVITRDEDKYILQVNDYKTLNFNKDRFIKILHTLEYTPEEIAWFISR